MSDGSQMGQFASGEGLVLAVLIVPFGAYALVDSILATIR
jgi:hypothetical protein